LEDITEIQEVLCGYSILELLYCFKTPGIFTVFEIHREIWLLSNATLFGLYFRLDEGIL